MTLRQLVLMAVIGMLLQGCQTAGNGSGGFAASPATTSRTAGLSQGPLSTSLGEGLGRNAIRRGLEAEFSALELGQTGNPVAWDAGSGIRGQVIPQQLYQVGSSSCRRYVHRISVEGEEREATGTACKEPGGEWKALT